MPVLLRRFSAVIIIVFLILVSASIALLVINKNAKDKFQTYIGVLENEKLMREGIGTSKLPIVMLLGATNMPLDNKNQLSFSNLPTQMQTLTQ